MDLFFLGLLLPTYRKLLAYRDSPHQEQTDELRPEFWTLFSTEIGYKQLDERKRLTRIKISELLLVLEHSVIDFFDQAIKAMVNPAVQTLSLIPQI